MLLNLAREIYISAMTANVEEAVMINFDITNANRMVEQTECAGNYGAQPPNALFLKGVSDGSNYKTYEF